MLVKLGAGGNVEEVNVQKYEPADDAGLAFAKSAVRAIVRCGPYEPKNEQILVRFSWPGDVEKSGPKITFPKKPTDNPFGSGDVEASASPSIEQMSKTVHSASASDWWSFNRSFDGTEYSTDTKKTVPLHTETAYVGTSKQDARFYLSCITASNRPDHIGQMSLGYSPDKARTEEGVRKAGIKYFENWFIRMRVDD
ncbi:hypothetical protein [Roseibium aggregatum]|uniref:TonB C-terminal domain-containing protein n=1 Tax=Roseibium aggregatum TaxID=187304 RepID=A0A926NS29_9HYPH|nr:hypothetical protein [Roseibium aggregatum]MBD1546357.1 hypothetical protein [Roseibium aggregatum]